MRIIFYNSQLYSSLLNLLDSQKQFQIVTAFFTLLFTFHCSEAFHGVFTLSPVLDSRLASPSPREVPGNLGATTEGFAPLCELYTMKQVSQAGTPCFFFYNLSNNIGI